MKPSVKKFLFEAGKTLLMLALSVGLAMAVIALASKEAGEAIRVFFLEPFADSYNISRILTESVPLMFTGVAVCIMSRAGQFNMFVEGGFFVGAFVAAVLSPELSREGGSFLMPLLCILIGALVAMTIGYIPAKLKASLGVDEFVCSLMLNYIVFWLVMYFLNYHWGDPDVAGATKYMEDWAKLPFLNADNELSVGFLLALAAPILGGIFLFKTKWGYSIRLLGDNRFFADYSGVPGSRVVVYSQLIGAGLAGFGGGVYMLGNYYRFTWSSLPNYGFDGFVIAIMAKNNPWLVPLASLFLGYLRVGAQQMALYTDVQNEVIYIIQGIIIILFGANFLVERRAKAKKKEAK